VLFEVTRKGGVMGRIELPYKFGDNWQDTRENVAPTAQSKFSLSDVASEWHYFNHGAFFAFGGLSYPQEDPMADWYARQPFGTQVLLQPFVAEVFAGIDSPVHLGKLTWNNVVCGVHPEFWQDVFEFLGGVCSVDRKKKQFRQAFSGDVEILDPVLVERHSALMPGLPTVTVTIFCMDGNDARWEVRPPISPIGPPRMVKVPPRAEMKAIADQVFSGDVGVLTRHANPAFQDHLDKYKAVQQQGPLILGPNDGSKHPTGNRR